MNLKLLTVSLLGLAVASTLALTGCNSATQEAPAPEAEVTAPAPEAAPAEGEAAAPVEGEAAPAEGATTTNAPAEAPAATDAPAGEAAH